MTIEGMRSDAESPLYPYFDMQERPSVAGIANDQLFIAEGTETIRLLLQQLVQRKNNTSFSPIQVKSIFVKPSIMFEAPVNLRAEVDNIHQAFGCVPFDVVIAQNLSIQSVVTGFEVSRGALACGVVPKERDWNWLLMYLGQLQHHSDQHSSLNENDSVRSLKVVALDGVSDSANLGSIIRTAAAFNVDAILLSSTCCDAWYRRTVRVSMGHVFNLPCVRVHDLPTAIQVLAQEFEIQSYAAVVQHSTDLTLERVEKGGIAASWMAVFGSEGSGISRPVVDACTYTLRIDMKEGVDSLSLPIAAGIILHGLHERSRTRAFDMQTLI
ncbi:hypothetical protein MPSEU_000470200 [Mayamaea pseudoterrestris]|nr:hypothetical protein MPSEU_000470200 [Mayamaea pseudoterrestris]